MEKNAIWISAYLFYPHSINDVIKDFIPKFLQIVRSNFSIYRYFFIRYNESGPHIRLRLKVDCAQEERVRQMLKTQWMEFVSLHHFNDSKSHQLPIAADNLMKFVPYQPELERYGGKPLMTTAELQFESSSEVIIKWISGYGAQWNKNAELILALKLNIVLFLSFNLRASAMMHICKIFIQEWLPSLYDPAKPASQEQSFFLSCFKKQYAISKEQIVPAVWQFFEDFKSGFNTNEALISYHKVNQLVKIKYEGLHTDLAKRPDIITSFMHMTHNRIGVFNTEEAYIVYLLYKCLEDITADERLS